MNTTRHMWAHPLPLICLGLGTALASAESLNAQDTPATSEQILMLPLKHTNAIEVQQVIERMIQGSAAQLLSGRAFEYVAH